MKLDLYRRKITEREYKDRVIRTEQELSTVERKLGIDSKRKLAKQDN